MKWTFSHDTLSYDENYDTKILSKKRDLEWCSTDKVRSDDGRIWGRPQW